MTDYVEWDGTDWGMEDDVLDWYSKLPNKSMTIGIEMTTFGRDIKPHRCAAYFKPNLDAEPVEMQPGDRLCYREFAGVYLLPNPGVLEFDDPEDYFPVRDAAIIMYTSSKWKLPEGWWEPWDMTGLTVKIDGHEVKLLGVEAFASGRSPSSPYTHSFGLGVGPEDARKIGKVRR